MTTKKPVKPKKKDIEAQKKQRANVLKSQKIVKK